MSHVKLSVFAVGFAVLVVTIGISFMNKKIIQEIREKDMQINSLIQEMGQIRQENVALHLAINEHGELLDVMQGDLLLVEEQMDVIDAGDLLDLQNQLDAANEALIAQDQAVDELLEATLEISRNSAAEDITSFLILGRHGSLTDTIMLALMNPDVEEATLLSIPRDLTVGGERFNSHYYRYGIDSMRDRVQEITGFRPEHYAVFDLDVFEEIIDLLGGIDVYVEQPIYDHLYPGPNGTYSTFSIDSGWQHLDGITALKYVRSRKSTTDFDRAERQQQVIEAVRDKVEDLNLFENADEMIEMYGTVSEALDTDVDLISMIGFALEYRNYTIDRDHVLSTSNYLRPITGINGAYLLWPNAGDWSEIQAYVQGLVGE